MWTALTILTIIGALAACVAAVLALGTYLRFRRARVAVQDDLFTEVSRLTGRASELEERLAKLDARASSLPIQIQELQRNLTDLRVLTGALTASLAQVQRLLSPAGLRSSVAAPLSAFSNSLRGSGRQ